MSGDNNNDHIGAIVKARTLALQKTSSNLARRAIQDIERLTTDLHVSDLIAKGADVNAKDNDGRTQLHWAAINGRKEVAELLIAKGSDVNAKNDYGKTPLHIAEHNDHKDLAELLKKHRARTPADLEKSLKGGTCRQRNGTFGCIFCR